VALRRRHRLHAGRLLCAPADAAGVVLPALVALVVSAVGWGDALLLGIELGALYSCRPGLGVLRLFVALVARTHPHNCHSVTASSVG